MNKYTILIITFGLFIFGCRPHPEPEPVPEVKTLVGHVYVANWVEEWGKHWGFYFVSDTRFDLVDYDSISGTIYEHHDTMEYTLEYPELNIDDGYNLIINEDYTEIKDPGTHKIYKKIK